MLAFSNDYYGMIFRATQSVELFCAYYKSPVNYALLASDIFYYFKHFISAIQLNNLITHIVDPKKHKKLYYIKNLNLYLCFFYTHPLYNKYAL